MRVGMWPGHPQQYRKEGLRCEAAWSRTNLVNVFLALWLFTYLMCVWYTVLGTLGDPVPHILAVILWGVALDDSSLQPFKWRLCFSHILLKPQALNLYGLD